MSALIDEDLQISFDQYLEDCKQYYDSYENEWFCTYHNIANEVIADYKLWFSDREKWIEEAKK